VSVLVGPAAVIAEGEVHLWRIALDRQDAHDLRRVLAPDELARADRFVFERDRRRFVVARAALRYTLADYLGVSPEAVGFEYGAHGKPALAASWPDVRFNLSHSDELALCAVTRGREIGVDVEHTHPLQDLEGLAERVFSRRERARLSALRGGDKLTGFFNAWTRKEAFIKALGEGLSHPLDRFDVSLAPRAPARLERIDGDAARAARWSLAAAEVDAGYTAAVVVDGGGFTLQARRWPEDLTMVWTR
jgi:4'-phosphopantetheinyl transferase